MKKLLSVSIAVFLLALVLSSFGVAVSAAETEGYYTYSVLDGAAKITKVDASISGDIVIPDTLGGYPVTSIDGFSFRYCENLTSVTLPDSITSVDDYVFSGCKNLISVMIPSGVTSIDEYAFYNCINLESITIPDSVASIGNSAFRYCESLKSITIPDNVASIGAYAFYGSGSLTSVTISDSVTSIGEAAFAHCTNLKNITIPNRVINIGNFAFEDCASLKSVTIPDSVTSIGNGVFEGCTSLKSVMIPDSVTSIGNFALKDCASLKSITLPDGVTSIGQSAFQRCTSLKSITLPDGITNIAYQLFYDCASLQSITIPESVTDIYAGAFSGCKSLKNVTFPENVKTVYPNAFKDCSALEMVVVYNKECNLDSNCGLSKNNTFYGYKGSAAEVFAQEIGAEFADINKLAKITKQPKTTYTKLDNKAKFALKAAGDGLTYQWYYKDVDGKEYKKCSGTEATYSIKMTEARKDRELYCVITDQYGYSVQTRTVTMKMAASIKTEPKTQYVQLGEKAKFTVKAVGDGLEYQWYYKSAGSSKYKKASCTKSSYTITMTEDRKDRKFYCVIKDKYGNEEKTKTVTMKMAASIKTEPKSVKTSIGKKATFTVKAVGDGLKYQWYYKDTDGKKYKKASCTKATYSIELTKARNGRKFYCVVTDKYGNTVKSKTVSMKKK